MSVGNRIAINVIESIDLHNGTRVTCIFLHSRVHNRIACDGHIVETLFRTIKIRFAQSITYGKFYEIMGELLRLTLFYWFRSNFILDWQGFHDK